MPPQPLEYQGHAAIAEFFQTRPWWGAQLARLVPTRANDEPAFGTTARSARSGHARR